MTRFFTILLICILVYLVFKSWRISIIRMKADKARRYGYNSKDTINKGMMVKCHTCSTYFPSADAITKKQDGEEIHFCSKSCLMEFRKS